MFDVLASVAIVEASAFVAAPLGGMMLAQLGADVVRVDPVEGGLDYGRWPVSEDGKSLYWAGLNKAKRSVLLDLRSAEGQELFAGLAAHAGTLLTNLPAPWASYERLRERRADLVKLQVLGHRDGRPAVDYTVNCAVGFPFATGPKGMDEPVNHVLPAWDMATGLMAALGLVSADRRRLATGEGAEIRLALADVALAMAGHLGHIGEWMVNGRDRARDGNHIYGSFGRHFRTRDGRYISLVGITRSQWRNLVAVTGLKSELDRLAAERGLNLDDEGDRYRARHDIAGLIEPWVARHDLAAVRGILDKAQVCWGPYRTFAQMVDEDPACSTANPMFSDVEQPGIGTYLMPGLPLDFAGLGRRATRPAPRPGEHTEEVLADWLGLAQAEIGRLVDNRVAALG